jgi:hypothetical protein
MYELTAVDVDFSISPHYFIRAEVNESINLVAVELDETRRLASALWHYLNIRFATNTARETNAMTEHPLPSVMIRLH